MIGPKDSGRGGKSDAKAEFDSGRITGHAFCHSPRGRGASEYGCELSESSYWWWHRSSTGSHGQLAGIGGTFQAGAGPNLGVHHSIVGEFRNSMPIFDEISSSFASVLSQQLRYV